MALKEGKILQSFVLWMYRKPYFPAQFTLNFRSRNGYGYGAKTTLRCLFSAKCIYHGLCSPLFGVLHGMLLQMLH